MRHLKTPCFLLAVLFFAGCATTEWVHPRKPKDMFAQDYNRCDGTVSMDPKVQAASQSGSKFMLQREIERCLIKEGWLQVEKQP
jgi:hypothetical protein